MAKSTPPSPNQGKGGPQPIGGLPPDYFVQKRIPYTGQGGVKGQVLAAGGNPRAAYGPDATLPINQGIQYWTGDDFRQLPQNPQVLQMLQGLLIQAGYMDSKGIQWGQPDPKTMAGFRELLKQSNFKGTDWHTTLTTQLSATGADGAAAARQANVPPLVVTLGNPDDIKATAQKTAQTLLGQNLPDDELNRFVSTFQQSQAAAQQADWQAKYGHYLATGQEGAVPGAGGTTTQEAQTEAGMARQAKAQIEQTHPGQAAAYGFGSQVFAALDSLARTGNLPSAGPPANPGAAGLG